MISLWKLEFAFIACIKKNLMGKMKKIDQRLCKKKLSDV